MENNMKTKKDVKYEEARNKLIIKAERYANKQCGNSFGFSGGAFKNREEWANAWNLTYHTKMNELAKSITL